MSWLEALVLGIIQGLTEFLPVSSSGHLELGKFLFDIDVSKAEDNLLFTVMVHGATVLSTMVVFRKDIWDLVNGIFRFQWNEETQFVSKVLFAGAPVILLGLFFEEQIEVFFAGKIPMVGIMLLLTALILFLTHFAKASKKDGVSFFKAFIIGLAQMIAVLPGISRSGATIGTALLLGVEKSKATRFSFLIVLIPIIGAMFLKLKDLFEAPASADIEWTPIMVGFIAAFLSGWFACALMLRIVRRGKLIYFAAYCFLVGILALVFSLNVFS